MIKVLLIESDSANRDIIKVGLSEFQVFEVDHAVDEQAVEMAEDGQYDLVIANVELAERQDGLQIIRRIREICPAAEIIALARGKSSRLLAKEKTASSLSATIPIPIDAADFYKTIARVKQRIESTRSRRSE